MPDTVSHKALDICTSTDKSKSSLILWKYNFAHWKYPNNHWWMSWVWHGIIPNKKTGLHFSNFEGLPSCADTLFLPQTEQAEGSEALKEGVSAGLAPREGCVRGSLAANACYTVWLSSVNLTVYVPRSVLFCCRPKWCLPSTLSTILVRMWFHSLKSLRVNV